MVFTCVLLGIVHNCIREIVMNTENKTVVRIALVDFWAGCNTSEIISRLFSDDYQIIEDEKKPDLLIYSCFGEKHLEYFDCKRLFFCGENIVPDFNTCDFAITTVKLQYANRSLWVPYGYFSLDTCSFDRPEESSSILNRKFCSFIYSQDNMGQGAMLRKEFCQQLMEKYKHVDCPGKILHNMETDLLTSRESVDDWHSSKLRFLSNYKFNIAFENSQAPGYITEKLIDCYMANTVPIYWGSSGDVFPFPKDSMICANDYASFDDLIARIKEIDEHDEMYLNMLNANPLRDEHRKLLPNYQAEISKFIRDVLNQKIQDKGLTLWTDANRCYSYMKEFRKWHIRFACKIKFYFHKIISVCRVICLIMKIKSK